MTVPRTHFVLVATSTSLVAVGGKHNRVALSTAERYDFTTNEWSLIAGLPNTLFSHAGCAHSNQVYVSGGCPGEDFTDEMHLYDVDRGAWQRRAPMTQVTVSLSKHICTGYNQSIKTHLYSAQ